MTEQQIPKLAGTIVEHQNAFVELSTEDAQWVIGNTVEAIGLFTEAVRNRGAKIAKKAAQVTKRVLTVWKNISVGGGTAEELITKVAGSCGEVSQEAKFLITKMTVAPTASAVDLVVLTPRELGFTSNPRTDAFMTEEFCAKWSSEHLDGYVIELCEVEDGPRLREQYQDQPNDEVLWMAMERIADSCGYPRVFVVGRRSSGVRWLDTRWVSPGGGWSLGGRIVFRLRKLSLPSVI